MPRFLRVLAVIALASDVIAAQQLSLDDILARLGTYLQQYEEIVAGVVAEERYVQSLRISVFRGGTTRARRLLVSDYALARSPGGHAWTGFRDTYEVDGKPVRDRDDRLAALLASGSADSSAQALRTTLRWEKEPLGFITIHYRHDANIGGLVPATMVEQYQRGDAQVDGEATYTNYRRFQTSGRLVPN